MSFSSNVFRRPKKTGRRPQAEIDAQALAEARRLDFQRRRGGAAGSLLTGGSGVGGQALVGRSTLLGG